MQVPQRWRKDADDVPLVRHKADIAECRAEQSAERRKWVTLCPAVARLYATLFGRPAFCSQTLLDSRLLHAKAWKDGRGLPYRACSATSGNVSISESSDERKGSCWALLWRSNSPSKSRSEAKTRTGSSIYGSIQTLLLGIIRDSFAYMRRSPSMRTWLSLQLPFRRLARTASCRASAIPARPFSSLPGVSAAS